MNKFTFDLIDAINRDGLGNESWGVYGRPAYHYAM